MSIVQIRDWCEGDASGLLSLMRELAVFEDYISEFVVTEADLLSRGLGAQPEFRAKVADKDGKLVGMAVSYDVPFTWTLSPTVYLKELFVIEDFRGAGVGRLLISHTLADAWSRGCRSMRWSVLAGNSSAERFYSRCGGKHDAKWHPWLLDEAGMANFSARAA